MFNSFFRRGKKENKALLEHKLYLARETPEPIFDISECDIHNVPSGIYSLCKVFQKSHLNLSFNCLESFNGGGNLSDLGNLSVLNISHNAFTALPVEIQLLTNLREFYMDNNQLKILPSTLCTLKHLQILYINNNNLQLLPENFGSLASLKSLHLENNPRLKVLPRSLHRARKLNELTVDMETFIYPPLEILAAGTEEILKFLCSENNCECYLNIQETDESDMARGREIDNSILYESARLEAKMRDLAKKKDQKNKDFLEIERQWEEIRQKEIEAANSSKVDKEKLLADIINQQEVLNTSLGQIQNIKDAERLNLIEKLRESENATSIAIQKLLQLNAKPSQQLLEIEFKEQEMLLEKANEHRDLKKAQILQDMQQLLNQESDKFKQLDESRLESTKTILELEASNNSNILQVLQSQNDKNRKLADTLRQDEELQKIAVATLLEKTDGRSWSLVQQVALVESQLAALTHIELNRRKLQIDQNVNDLAQQRVELSYMLLDLVEQQNERRAQLRTTLQILEEKNEEQAEDFWMRQYQALLDRMPIGLVEMQRNMDPTLVEILLMEGLLNYLPFLAKSHLKGDELTLLNEEYLKDLGITNMADVKKLLSAIANYKKCKEYEKIYPQEEPSAPPMEPLKPSAPRGNLEHNMGTAEAECVVCMDEKCQVIYIPCGHYCCCLNCSTTITDCPMCRAKIERIIPVNSSN